MDDGAGYGPMFVIVLRLHTALWAAKTLPMRIGNPVFFIQQSCCCEGIRGFIVCEKWDETLKSIMSHQCVIHNLYVLMIQQFTNWCIEVVVRGQGPTRLHTHHLRIIVSRARWPTRSACDERTQSAILSSLSPIDLNVSTVSANPANSTITSNSQFCIPNSDFFCQHGRLLRLHRNIELLGTQRRRAP